MHVATSAAMQAISLFLTELDCELVLGYADDIEAPWSSQQMRLKGFDGSRLELAGLESLHWSLASSVFDDVLATYGKVDAIPVQVRYEP